MGARRPHIFVAGSTNEKISEEYNIAAQKIGKAICENKYTLVFDGAYGLPGLAAAQFLEQDDNFENVLICACNQTHRLPYEWIRQLKALMIECEKQSDVTRTLIKESEYLIFMKGSTGTLTELFQAIDTKKNKEHNKMIIVLNIAHQWDEVESLLKTLDVSELYQIANTPEEAMGYIKEDLNKLGYKDGDNFFRRKNPDEDIESQPDLNDYEK